MDVVGDILTSAMEGDAKLTRLLYGSSLSSGRLQQLLPLMLAADLLAKDERGYATTEKGKAFLKLYAELKSMFSIGPLGNAVLDPALVQKASDLVGNIQEG
jgi:predicted transcriptional regulator